MHTIYTIVSVGFILSAYVIGVFPYTKIGKSLITFESDTTIEEVLRESEKGQ